MAQAGIAVVGISTLALFYRRHLKVQPVRELMAIMGIAAGVALLFAVQVSNQSITGSFEQLAHGIAGKATLEVAARGPEGFDQRLFDKIGRSADVEVAAPILERRIRVVGPEGRRPLTLVGADDRIAQLGGRLLRRFKQGTSDASAIGLWLTERTAEEIGVKPGDRVTVEVGAELKRVRLAKVLREDEVGPLVDSPVAVAPLGLAQKLADMPGRITRIAVAPAEGRADAARATLGRVAKGRLNVRSSGAEAKLLTDAAKPERQATALFAAISLVVGILLAYNAMLLATAERRAFVTYLRRLGARDRTVLASLCFDALVLGVVGSALGLVLGDLLSRYVLHSVPIYLTAAFPVGGQRVVGFDIVALSAAGGVFAALAASAGPAARIFRTTATESAEDQDRHLQGTIGGDLRRLMLWGGGALIACATLVAAALPQTTIFAVGALVVGIALILPGLTVGMLAVAMRASDRLNGAVARLAIAELRKTPSRSIAVVATGALAVFAIVAMSGSAADMQRGASKGAADILSNADLWVRVGGDENYFDIEPFDPRKARAQLEALPAVESVGQYRESFLDLPDRRLWAAGVARSDRGLIAPSQIVHGDDDLVQRRLKEGGWAALTAGFAEKLKVKPGESFSLPTPSGTARLRLAATISNYGWIPGTLVLNDDDYGRLWRTQAASQLTVRLGPGVSLAAGKRLVQEALGDETPLSVETADERRTSVEATVRNGLARLNQISDIVLLAAVASVIAVMLAAVWQRRARLDALVSLGMRWRQFVGMLFVETGLMLVVGGAAGLAFGILGQVLDDRWLELTTGTPIVFAPAAGLGLRAIAVACAGSILASILAVRLTVRFEPTAAFSAE